MKKLKNIWSLLGFLICLGSQQLLASPAHRSLNRMDLERSLERSARATVLSHQFLKPKIDSEAFAKQYFVDYSSPSSDDYALFAPTELWEINNKSSPHQTIVNTVSEPLSDTQIASASSTSPASRFISNIANSHLAKNTLIDVPTSNRAATYLTESDYFLPNAESISQSFRELLLDGVSFLSIQMTDLFYETGLLDEWYGAFFISGTLIPEPATWLLLLACLPMLYSIKINKQKESRS